MPDLSNIVNTYALLVESICRYKYESSGPLECIMLKLEILKFLTDTTYTAAATIHATLNVINCYKESIANLDSLFIQRLGGYLEHVFLNY